MPILLDKTLTAFASPLGFAVSFLAVGLLLAAARLRRAGLVAGLLSFLLLWAASTPWVANRLLATLEDQYPALRVDDYPASDAVIVLGGAISPATARNPYPDLGSASDRVLHALRIWRAGKAKVIVIAGGQVFDPNAANTEAAAIRDLLVSWGIDPAAIIIEERSRNTHENAVLSAPLLAARGLRSALLVTSASHMPRALAAFRMAGVNVLPAATDYGTTGDLPPLPLSVLPDASSLDASTRAMREWLGLLVYRLRGWA